MYLEFRGINEFIKIKTCVCVCVPAGAASHGGQLMQICTCVGNSRSRPPPPSSSSLRPPPSSPPSPFYSSIENEVELSYCLLLLLLFCVTVPTQPAPPSSLFIAGPYPHLWLAADPRVSISDLRPQLALPTCLRGAFECLWDFQDVSLDFCGPAEPVLFLQVRPRCVHVERLLLWRGRGGERPPSEPPPPSSPPGEPLDQNQLVLRFFLVVSGGSVQSLIRL